MKTNFYVKENKLKECKAFIRTLPSARFNCNPIKRGEKWNISLTLTVEDGNKLSSLISSWEKNN